MVFKISLVFKIPICACIHINSLWVSYNALFFYSGIKSDNARHSTQVSILKTPILKHQEKN